MINKVINKHINKANSNTQPSQERQARESFPFSYKTSTDVSAGY